MTNGDQIFANGRLAVMSTKLFGADKFNRLAECSSVAEAVRILSESGYGSIVESSDYEKLLQSETDIMLSNFKELCCNEKIRSYFLCKYDYCNAKMLMKAKYMRVDGTENCFKNASFDPSDMQNDFTGDNYSAYSKEMATACDEIDFQFASGNRLPKNVDTILDKAMYVEMRRLANRSCYSLIKKFFKFQVDSTNLFAMFRCKKAGISVDNFENMVIDGGMLSKDTLVALWSGAKIGMPTSELRQLWSYLSQGKLVDAENAEQACVYNLLSTDVDTLTVQPALEYFVKKSQEINLVRYIIICVKNGVAKDVIKHRIR